MNIRTESGNRCLITAKSLDVDNGCVKICYWLSVSCLQSSKGEKTVRDGLTKVIESITIRIRSKNLLLVASVILLTCTLNAHAQQFRQPVVPQVQGELTLDGNGGQLQGQVIQGNLSPMDKFVPESSGDSFGFVPVRPRNGSLNDADSQIFGSRTAEQERILQKIRRGNFEEEASGFSRQKGPQTIRQKYDNGKDQLVRQVVQDEEGNFYNHGPWQLYNRNGELMASGQFAEGLMDGTWERWHMQNSGGIFATKPFTDFEGPFISTATFSNGKLAGVWVISDRFRRKIVEVPYQNGKRHGTATWWFPSAERMRVIAFKDGMLDGPMYEWDEKNKLVRNDEFIEGQKVIRQRTMYRPKQPRSESYYLGAELSLESDDNWWDAEPAEYVQLGERVQHGPTFAWHQNGQRKMVGQYKNNIRVGQFNWWHENGQRSLTGRYDEDGAKVGPWTWWHENGMKAIQGEYDADQEVGKWTWWTKEGQVRDSDDFGESPESNGILVEPLITDTDDDSGTDPDDVTMDPPEQGIEDLEQISPMNIDADESDTGGAFDALDIDNKPPRKSLPDPFGG